MGQQALNSFDPTGVANKHMGMFKGLWNDQQGRTDNYLKQYADTIKSNPSVTRLYEEGGQKFNVAPLAQQANYLQNEVTDALPTQYNAARGTDIGNAQVQNATAQRLQYLGPQAGRATSQAQTAQELAQGYVQAGITQNEFNLLPIKEQGRMLTDAMAREQSGFTTVMQNELDGLKAKLQAGVQLTGYEYDRANTLTQAENAYKIAQMQADSALRVAQENNRYQSVGPGSTLTDTFSRSMVNPGMLTSGSGYYRF